MSRYVDISPYEKCRIVSNPEDNGFPVSELPTVDAEPVRHGHWDEWDDTMFNTVYRCSVCGEDFVLIDGTPSDNLYNYCPNCGAKMDEVSE